MTRISVLTVLLFFYSSAKTQSLSKLKHISTVYCSSTNACFYLEPISEASIKKTEPICIYPVSYKPKQPLTFKLDNYVTTLGLFCKQELKLDKITPMPVRFRLGSLEYVNWMERKPNAVYNR
jgi:hypothetical protein